MADGAQGEMAERFNAAVLKTVVQQWTGGSNPSLSATKPVPIRRNGLFAFCRIMMRPDAQVPT